MTDLTSFSEHLTNELLLEINSLKSDLNKLINNKRFPLKTKEIKMYFKKWEK